MANVPYPLTASDLQELRAQIQELIRQVFEEKIGGADLGDVFSLPGDVLTLVIGDESLTKSGNKLAAQLSATGGLNVVSDGLSVKLADTTITKTASGLSVTTPAPTGPAVTVTDETTFGIGTNVGAGTRYARNDHTHGSPTNPITAHVLPGDPHNTHPIGSYYFNSTGVDPNGELGYGTWTQVAQGQFLIGAT